MTNYNILNANTANKDLPSNSFNQYSNIVIRQMIDIGTDKKLYSVP